jgi:hypothetical protein
MAQQRQREDILLLAKAGLDAKEIAEQVNVHVRTVTRVCLKGSATRKKQEGNRPSVLNKRIKRIIKTAVKDVVGGPGVRKVSTLLTTKGFRVSPTTISRFLRTKTWGKSRKGTKEPLLSKKNVSDRMTFAKRLRNERGVLSDDRWEALQEFVCFTDESTIPLHAIPNRQNTRIRSADPDAAKFIKTVKHDPVTVQVYGGVTWRGMTNLHFLEKDVRVNKEFYRDQMLPKYKADLLELYGDDFDGVVFQEDGAKPHIAKISSAYVQDNFPGGVLLDRLDASYTTFFWPGNSPDLNVIEQMWSLLKDSIFVEPRPRNEEQLKSRLTDTWRKLEADNMHQKLISSFPRRIQSVLDKDGAFTGY